MSEKVTVELRKAETVLRRFDKRWQDFETRLGAERVKWDDERSAYIQSLDPELVRKLRAIGVLEEQE